MVVFYILWPIFCGVVIPLVLKKGLSITITHKHEQPEQPKKQEYNESMTKHLPAEVQQYYHTTNGQNRF